VVTPGLPAPHGRCGRFAAFAGGGVGFLEACGNGSGSSSQTSGTPKKGGHVTEGWAFDIKTSTRS